MRAHASWAIVCVLEALWQNVNSTIPNFMTNSKWALCDSLYNCEILRIPMDLKGLYAMDHSNRLDYQYPRMYGRLSQSHSSFTI